MYQTHLSSAGRGPGAQVRDLRRPPSPYTLTKGFFQLTRVNLGDFLLHLNLRSTTNLFNARLIILKHFSSRAPSLPPLLFRICYPNSISVPYRWSSRLTSSVGGFFFNFFLFGNLALYEWVWWRDVMGMPRGPDVAWSAVGGPDPAIVNHWPA